MRRDWTGTVMVVMFWGNVLWEVEDSIDPVPDIGWEG